ncbi:MAG: alpha/beta hydrolase [Crocinitomicaceae bacterium]
MKKQRLVLLSDLWVQQQSEWIQSYLEQLEPHFNCVYYDVAALAGISTQDSFAAEIHAAFVQGGIDRAVQALLNLEKKKTIVLAFSIGGTIAWKAALKGLPTISLTAVSSTRLRKEYQKPTCEIALHFGDQDVNRPQDEWFEALEIYPEIHFAQQHEFYMLESACKMICDQLIEQFGS